MNKRNKNVLIRIGITVISIISITIIPINIKWQLIFYMIPYLIIGYDLVWCAILNLLHGQLFDEKFLMSIATIGAFVTGQYTEAIAVMLFYQVGELFQRMAVGKSRRSIASLMDIKPDYAILIRDGKEVNVSPDAVKIGDTVIIRPGEKIPLDGVIEHGLTTVDNSALTGESMPVDKTVGDEVFGGSINLTGLIRISVKSIYEQSTVAKVMNLVEESAQKKAKVENFITRFSRLYTPCIVVCALLLAIVPPILFSGAWIKWINRSFIFLVVSCPCALVVSIPLSFFGGIGGASRNGILIKGADNLEALSKVKNIGFDKTGTITKGTFIVDDIHPETVSKEKLLEIAAIAESYSNHPAAEAILTAHSDYIDKNRIGKIEEIPGKGIKAQIDDCFFYVGNNKLMDMVGAKWHNCHLGGTIIHVSENEMYLGHIIINDQIKNESKNVINCLKSLGIKKTILLSGDSERVVNSVAKAINIDEYYSELLPYQKVQKVEEIISSGGSIGFVGDGINDAPVLSRADVGIAMGALGSDAAIESADIVIMDDNLSKIPVAIKISRKTMNIVKQNIMLALVVKFVILFLGLIGLANMWMAVFGDVGVMIIAILNAMRCMYNNN